MAVGRLIVTGPLVFDPDGSFTPDGLMIVKWTMPVDFYDSSKKQNTTEWVHFVLFGNKNPLPNGQKDRAESFLQNCFKGTIVHLEGDLRVKHYTDRQGNEKTQIELIPDVVKYVSNFGEKNRPKMEEAEMPESVKQYRNMSPEQRKQYDEEHPF